MTLKSRVINLVRTAKQATVLDVMRGCPGYTQQQITSALQLGVRSGELTIAGKMQTFTSTGGSRYSVYGVSATPPDPETPRNGWRYGRPASVWDFGQGVSR